MSIKDIMNLDPTQLKNMIFINTSHDTSTIIDQYFSVKINYLTGENDNEIMISIIDASD